MALETPALHHLHLPELASRYVKTDTIPWEPMRETQGIEMKVLVSDADSGLFTGLLM